MFLKSNFLCINVEDIVYISEAERMVEREGEANSVWHETRFYLRNRDNPVIAKLPLCHFTLVQHPVAVPMFFGSTEVEHA